MVEYGGIVILGILAQWLAWRLKVPSILPLILIGLVVGPFSTLFTGGEKWISPIWDPAQEHGLFPGEGLFHFVELAIGIILFEGSMTLKRDELGGVGDTIIKLISLGAVVTFVLAGVLAHYIVNLNWSVSFLIASLIIVTGPTVIAPILRNVPLNQNVATVLKWEGILIDPIGALAAVLVYQFISTSEGGNFTSEALSQFLRIVFVSLFELGVMLDANEPFAQAPFFVQSLRNQLTACRPHHHHMRITGRFKTIGKVHTVTNDRKIEVFPVAQVPDKDQCGIDTNP